VAADGWDIRARWFGVLICATPRLGELGRGITIPWRVIAALITASPAVAKRPFWPYLGPAALVRNDSG
jgi:hypothetical protein